MKREVQPELLDALPPEDPRAVESRQDLQRVNKWMGHINLMANVASASCGHWNRVVEIGAGDGTFMKNVCQQLWFYWDSVELVLVERQAIIQPATLAEIELCFWKANAATMDVFEWLANPDEPVDVILANLFLHHFDERRLRELLRLAAERTSHFIACEPRRAWRSLYSSRLLGLIGCNDVTRHDAAVSVRAGFCGRELSALWPANGEWELREEKAGLFSHLFVARRKV